jgi:histidinol phosphatase-like enzyme
VCPHDRAEHCACRKPNPGLLIRAAGEHGLDLSSSWIIGDAESDVEAGKRAGCKARILPAGSIEQPDHRADICSHNLASVVSTILQLSQMVTLLANA